MSSDEKKKILEDYVYLDVEEYEAIVGFKVKIAFKIGWSMARVKNKHFAELKKGREND